MLCSPSCASISGTGTTGGSCSIRSASNRADASANTKYSFCLINDLEFDWRRRHAQRIDAAPEQIHVHLFDGAVLNFDWAVVRPNNLLRWPALEAINDCEDGSEIAGALDELAFDDLVVAGCCFGDQICDQAVQIVAALFRAVDVLAGFVPL